jgi:putative hemolysin
MSEAGLTIVEQADVLGVSRLAISIARARLGIAGTVTSYMGRTHEQIMTHYHAAKAAAQPQTAAAARAGISVPALQYHLRKAGIYEPVPQRDPHPCTSCGGPRERPGSRCARCDRRHHRNGSCPACGLPWNTRNGRPLPCARCGSTIEAARAAGLVPERTNVKHAESA